MSTQLSGEVLRSLTAKSNVPLVFRGFVKNWPVCDWNSEKWCSVFGDKEIPFRCLKRDLVSDEPCWERKCSLKSMTFKTFIESLDSSDEWMYFDYKYLHQWFGADTELSKVLFFHQWTLNSDILYLENLHDELKCIFNLFNIDCSILLCTNVFDFARQFHGKTLDTLTKEPLRLHCGLAAREHTLQPTRTLMGSTL